MIDHDSQGAAPSPAPLWQQCLICHSVDRGDGVRVSQDTIPAEEYRAEYEALRISHGICSPTCTAEHRRRYCGVTPAVGQ